MLNIIWLNFLSPGYMPAIPNHSTDYIIIALHIITHGVRLPVASCHVRSYARRRVMGL